MKSELITALFCQFMEQSGIVFDSEAEIDKAQLMFEAGYRARDAARGNDNTLVG